MRISLSICFFTGLFAVLCARSALRAADAPLGAPTFLPTPERPIGWRGDGTGRYPEAKPPLAWSREKVGEKYTTKGILWATPLPNIAVASSIIVGNRIFLTSEVADLICLDKATGKILWIRSNSEFEGLSDAERTDPAYAAKLVPLTQQLAAVNKELVEALNAQQAVAPAGGYKAPSQIAKKRELEKQIHDAQLAIDKKTFERYWGQGVFGFAGPTPTSDGKLVGAFFTTGLTAVYDLEGNRKWIHRGAGGGSEHGNFASPLIISNRLVVWAHEMRAYELDSGKLAWTVPAKAFNTYGSLFRVQAGGEAVAAFQWGFFVRVRDGQAIWDSGIFGDSVSTPIVEGDTIYTHVGYPKNNDEVTKGFQSFQIPADTAAGKLKPLKMFATNWAAEELPIIKDKTPFDRGYVASPLYVDGLIYQLTQGGGLIVHNAVTGEVVYRKVLPLKPKTEYWNWAGASTSPTLAGKYIYLMDNQGSTIILQPGKEYKAVAQNMIEELRDGKEQAQFLTTPVFEGTRMYYRSPGYLYCIGE